MKPEISIPDTASGSISILNIKGIFDRIGDDIEVDFICEIIDEGLSSLSTNLDKLQTAINSQITNNIIQLAHAIKGTSSNIGAETLSEIARQLETEAKTDDITKAQSYLTHMTEIFDQIKQISREDIINFSLAK